MPRKTPEQLMSERGGESQEESARLNPSGWYVYRDEAGQEVDRILVVNHPKFGSAQADACVRVGYQWDGAATPEEVQQARATLKAAGDSQVHSSHVPQENNTVPKAEFDALSARLAELERKQAQGTAEKPLRKMNKAQLTAKAEALGLEVTPEMTNNQIADLIESSPSN